MSYIKKFIDDNNFGSFTELKRYLSARPFNLMIKEEGVRSLYRGLLSPVAGYGLIKATAFASYNQGKTWVLAYNRANGQKDDKLNLIELTMCGAFAGLCQTFIRAPVEQIKVVMQARLTKYQKHFHFSIYPMWLLFLIILWI